MLKLTTDLVVLLCVLGTTAVVLMGWGNLTWRILGVSRPSKVSVLTIWLGFCIVVGCLEFIHLFVPIDWRVTVGVTIVGLLGQAGLFKSKPALLEPKALYRSNAIGLVMIAISAIQRYRWRSLAAMVVIITWCLRAMETPTMYDSGLYHFGSIRWLNEYPIVPGLGNLHWRLALNQSYFGFLALLNFAPYWGKGYATGGLFLLLLSAFTLIETGLAQSRIWRWVFGGTLFSYLCLLSGSIANPMPDSAVALLQIAIFSLLSGSFSTRDFPTKYASDELARIQIVVILLALTIVTVKLSSLAFAGISLMLTLASVCSPKLQRSKYTLPLNFAVLLVSILFALHVARSYLLSGAPFFPSPFGGAWSLPWALEDGVAHNESQLIYSWAKRAGIAVPGDVPAGFGWLTEWLRTLPIMLKCSIVFGSVLLVSTILYQSKCAGKSIAGWYWLGTPIFGALLFWFFTAPDPRFLGAIGFLYFAWTAHMFLSCVFSKVRFIERSSIRIGSLINFLVLGILLFFFVRWSLSTSLSFGWANLPAVELDMKTNRSGVKAFVPQNGSQCWNASLPCTGLLHDSLRIDPMPAQTSGGSLLNRLWFSMERD
jgi:hypothetical protein